MSRNELIFLIFGLALVALVAVLLLYFIINHYKQRKLLIENGVIDEELKKEYDADHSVGSRFLSVVGAIVSVLLTVVFVGALAFGIYSKVNNDLFPFGSNTENVLVVKTASMSKKNEKNTYLVENNLNDQFGAYDLVFIAKPTTEDALKLYDVVVYKYDDALIIHRIIGIEPPDATHEKTYFRTRGDANSASDPANVTFDDIVGIYTGKTVPFVGYAIAFFQSPLGYLAFVILLAYAVLMPIYEGKLDKARDERLKLIGYPEPIPAAEANDWNIKKRSFSEKILANKKELKDYYNELKTEALSYGLKSRISYSGDTFRLHKKTYLKITVSGKSIKVLYALNPKHYKSSTIPVIDLSKKASKSETPCGLWVKSDLALKRAKILIKDVCEKDGLLKKEIEAKDWTKELVASEPAKKPAKKVNKPKAKVQPVVVPAKREFNIKKTSFEDKLKKADKSVKASYKEIKEYALSKGLKERTSFSGETFRLHKKTYLKIAISGKSLKVFFALKAKDYANSTIPLIDLSNKASKAETPSALWIKSDLALKRAKTLIDDVTKDLAE